MNSLRPSALTTLLTASLTTVCFLAACSPADDGRPGGGSGSGDGVYATNPAPGAQGSELAKRVDAWIEANDYVAALEWLSGLDQEDPDVRLQLEKTWLNNGLHNMNTFDAGQMRTRMNDALRSFANVLELNPQNQIAREQIVSILAVYSTMPGRGPEPDVAERLAGLGFQP